MFSSSNSLNQKKDEFNTFIIYEMGSNKKNEKKKVANLAPKLLNL